MLPGQGDVREETSPSVHTGLPFPIHAAAACTLGMLLQARTLAARTKAPRQGLSPLLFQQGQWPLWPVGKPSSAVHSVAAMGWGSNGAWSSPKRGAGGRGRMASLALPTATRKP